MYDGDFSPSRTWSTGSPWRRSESLAKCWRGWLWLASSSCCLISFHGVSSKSFCFVLSDSSGKIHILRQLARKPKFPRPEQ